MDPRDPRFNLRSRYDFSFSPRSIPHHPLPPPPPPPVAPSNYYSHPQFHPPPLPLPQFHHCVEDSRRFLTYPDSHLRDSRVYSLDGIDRRETRVFNERITPDPAQLDWGREREREGTRKDGFLEEEFRVRVRKNEYLEENKERIRSRIREYGNTVDDFPHRINGREQEKRDYLGNIGEKKWDNIGEKKWDNIGDGYFGKEKDQTIESGWNSPKKLEQKTSAFGRIQSGKSVWSRIKENARNLQGLKGPNVDLKLNSKKKFMPRKMKRTVNDRDQIIIQVSCKDSNDYTCNKPISSEMKAKETVSSEMPICNSSKMKAIGSSSMPINNSSVIKAGSSGTASNDSKTNSIDLPSAVKSNGLKRKAVDASCKQPTSIIKTTNASAKANVGLKKANASSSNPVAKKPVKNLKTAKKVGAVKTKVGSQAIQVSESKLNNVTLVSNEKNVNNKDTKQSNKDSDSTVSIHVPMDVETSMVDGTQVIIGTIKVNEGKPANGMLESTVKSDVDSVEPQPDKDVTSAHVSMDATAIPVNSVVEDSSKIANMEHGDSIILQVQSPSCGPTVSDRSLIETSLLETRTTEKYSLDANLVHGNDAGDNLKELMKFVDDVAHNSTSRDDSDAKIIIDVSSDSSSSFYSSSSSACSSDESSFTESPCQAAFPVERNDDLYNEDIDVVSTGPSLETTSASKLVDDLLIINQVSHKDDNVNMIGDGIEDNHSLVAPSVEDELEEEDKNRHENKNGLPIDVYTFGNDKVSSISFPGNEGPSTPIASPGNEDISTQIAEVRAVNVTVQKQSKQLVSIGPAQENSADIPDTHDVLNCVTNQQNVNGKGKEDSIKNGSFICSKKLSNYATEMGTKKMKQASIYTDLTGSTKPIPNSKTPKVFPNQSNPASSLKANSYLARNPRNKTWHRTDSPTMVSPAIQNLQIKVGANKHPMKKQSPKKFTKGFNSSYVRKGNSLVRKQTNNVAHHPILPFGVDERKNKFDTQKDSHDTLKDSHDTQKESLDIQTKYSTPVLENPTLESKTEALKLPVSMDMENTIKSELPNKKRMVYVKNKSNQLVAASTEKNDKPSFSSLSSDIYYMRNRNQLIRNASSSENQSKQNEISVIDNSKFNHQAVLNNAAISSRTVPSKKRLEKVQRKIHKYAKLSRVWTPCGQSADNRIMPYIFPWKRATYRRSLMGKNSLNPSRRSLSLISRKLQHTRKRDTIYTVSNDGFSLRKSRVVSVGRPNLKWSKSIDKDSKKANEEATLAVVEAERNKRERKRKRSSNIRKKENSLTQRSNPDIELQPGERVFRFGSIRYKMDASQHTLVRIGDEQSSDSVGQHSKKPTFVPRRLLIGNNEYIRKGNGNQLVRDPKKLVRMLASEKIRWSIHTARKRLAKKQQYCQFFTRFGKCNKISGKCPYIHDPDKVAICTKFLRGSCNNTACKLTHKIIPERMPDCSYYLQGLCTKLNCPYRHVHVNPQASVCDGFLKGFCAEGDECRKKHSYACPMFEATGECPQGSKCKLHHPKNANRSKKRKRSKTHKNITTIGRYFGSNVTEDSEIIPTNSSVKCNTDNFADFICLDCDTDIDDGDIDDGENIISKDSYAKELDSDIDGHSDELDALIKPIRILNNDR